MKKIILLLIILFAISPIATVFAEITRIQSGNGVDVEWKFKPEVSTHAGYNFDWEHFGMEGKAKLTLKSEIRAKSTEEFVSEDADFLYAKIEVRDLKIKFEVEGPQSQGRSDDELVKTTAKVTGKDGKEYEVLTKDTKIKKGKQGVRVSWGSINGTVYIGPAYIELKTKEHEKIDYVSGLSDMDFVTIREDVVTPLSTAKYQTSKLFAKEKDLKTSDDGSNTLSKRTLDYTHSDINNEGMNKQLAAFKVGFKMDKIIDVAVGFSTKYSFRESLAAVHRTKRAFNPFALSIYASVLAVDNLTLKVKNSYIFSKVENEEIKFLGEGNPLSLGALVGYKINIGDSLFIKPSVGFDVAMENKAPYGEASLPVVPSKKSDKDIFTASYEVGAGLVLGFQDSTRYFVSPKKTDVMDLFKGDEKVLDGLGFGILYGSSPYEAVRKIDIQYIGAKLTFWDSEDEGIIGLVPGLNHGLILNFNYALGAKKKVDDLEYDIRPTADVGLGYEGSYTILFLKLKAGALFKAFNITGQNKDYITDSKGVKKTYERNEVNPFDLRVRFGVDIVKIVPNTTFEIMWESGDLLRTKKSSIAADGYHKTENFFRAKETGTGADGAESKAEFGYISAGVKIAF